MNISTEQWNTAIRVVLTKSVTDSEFRAKCLNNPAGAVLEVSGLTAPKAVAFSETPIPGAITLPPLGGDPDEITDHEMLENVAGGGAWGYPSIGDNTNICGA